MGKGRRRRSYSDSSESEYDSDSGSSSSERHEVRRCSISGSDQELADNWVLCDRCTKWRRIPASFADQIKEDEPWFCVNNPNKAFASCSVPQELTNEEIDADADSDGAGESDEESLKRRRIPAVWQMLKDNVLAHRKRKVQDEDDIMICHCKPVYRGGDGCGPDCINRMLCIECVPGFCPSEEKCTNQMFSKRMYANLEIRRAGAKGFGLFALEDIKAGQFIIEYIGEVLEEDEYQRRKDYYMSVGQRHYYFMNIGNGEVIDACRKGNISRFINHSCEPNCETQKWLVHGELAIGLFAVRDIPKDTELTFDYNFERYGDKPMRCYCRSTNCRKFIGGMQDNYDVSLLPAVEPDDASHDLPPIMLKDSDMDPNMRMLLDWRVGVKVDKAKELGMVTRLERLCKARNVDWTVKHFYGQEPIVALQQQGQQQQAPVLAPGLVHTPAPTSSVRSGDRPQPGPQSAEVGSAAAAQAKAKQQRKAEKVAAGAAAGGAAKAGKAAGTSSAKQAAADGSGLARLRIEDSTGGCTPGGAGTASKQAPATTPSVTPEVAQVRGPKALFKQWKIMQQQDTTPAPATEEKPAATPSSPPSPRSPHSPPSPQAPPSPRSSLSLDNDDAALDELRNAATEAARHVPLRKRLRRLPPKPPAAPPQAAATAPTASPGQNGTSAPAGQAPARRTEGSGGASNAPGSGPAPTTSVGIARRSSFGSAGAVPAANTAAPSSSPPRSTSPPPSFSGRGAAGAGTGPGASHGRRLRSEIDRRLEEVVGSKGGLRDPSRQNIIKVLRLFNLCDMGGNVGRHHNGFGPAAGGRYINGGGGGMSRNGEDGGMAGPGPGSAGLGGTLTARQRARMADLSLLLDVVLKTTSTAAKKELVACGLLTQLHQAMGRNTGKDYCVILRKVLRAVEGLPLEANDVYAVRSAHGNFVDMLKQLSSNSDYDVRTKAAALLKKFPPSAVTDQRLLQLMAAPPARFGHGRGGGMRGMGGGTFGGGGMLPMPMQQQLMIQQQLLKQQQMMRLKESAAAAAGNGALPPPPPLGPGDHPGDGLTPGGLPRTSSNVSTGADEPGTGTDAPEHGGTSSQNGIAGLPPLGPGARQRFGPVSAAAAAVLANRPGLFRGMPSRGSGLGAMANGGGMSGLNSRGGGGGMGVMGTMSLSYGLRPPSPINADSYGGVGDDHHSHISKRRKFSHAPGGLDGMAASADGFAGTPLPGPPPRPGYSLGAGHHHHHHHQHHRSFADGPDGPHRDLDLPLPPPPGLSMYHYGVGRGGSEERDPAGLGLGPRLISMEEVFALRRPRQRPPALPPAQGRLQPERHLHGELSDIVVLFALGLYGRYGKDAAQPPRAPAPEAPVAPAPATKAQAEGKPVTAAAGEDADEEAAGRKADEEAQPKAEVDAEAPAAATEPKEDASPPLSPIIYPDGPPLSPILEPPLPPPPPLTLAATATVTAAGPGAVLPGDGGLPLPPPPPLNGVPMESGTQLRPLRLQPPVSMLAAGGAGPSPYHQQGSPAPYSGWDSLPGTATAAARGGAASVTSTPTVSALGSAAQHGSFAPAAAAATASGATAAATVPTTTTGLPPVVPISSLSDWRMGPAAAAAATAASAGTVSVTAAANGRAGDAVGAATSGLMLRASPHTSPEVHGAAEAAGAPVAGGRVPAAAAAEEAENIDEWLRPVSLHHADTWDEPDPSFEAYVADMVRHRLGKYMQPEHPSRVSVQEASMLRAKVYGEVVAKERRAWEERRRAGVFKPIERHKLEANLKEFVRSTIKRMREREKVPGPSHHGGAGGSHAGQHHHSGASRPPPHPGSGGHHPHHPGYKHHPHHRRQSLSTPQASTPPPQGAAPEGAAWGHNATLLPSQLTASPAPDGVGAGQQVTEEPAEALPVAMDARPGESAGPGEPAPHFERTLEVSRAGVPPAMRLAAEGTVDGDSRQVDVAMTEAAAG